MNPLVSGALPPMPVLSKMSLRWTLPLTFLIMACLWLVLLSGTNWRTAFSPDDAGTLAASFGPADHQRSVIIAMDARSPLLAAGAKLGDKVSFDRGSDADRFFAMDEKIGVTLHTAAGPRHVTLRPVADLQVAQQSGVLAAAFLSLGVCAVFSLALAFMLVTRRGDSVPIRALALGLLGDSIDFYGLYLAGGELQNVLVQYLKPVLLVPSVLGILYFTLSFHEERPLLQRRPFKIAFWIIAVSLTVVTGAILFERANGLPLNAAILTNQARRIIYMACYAMTLIALFESWRTSEGSSRRRMAWIAVCLGVPTAFFFISNASTLFQVGNDRNLNTVVAFGTAASYVGLGYALLRHRIFDLSFAVNRTLVFSVTSLLLFLAFWLIEQGVHKLVHFEAAENNAILGGVIAFGLFFSFNRLHHRVEHWIEHLFFRQWRARDLALRAFVAKAAHFTESGALVSAFGGALDSFSGGAGNAIYLAGRDGKFERVHSSVALAPAILDLNDDIAVSMRASRQAVILAVDGAN